MKKLKCFVGVFVVAALTMSGLHAKESSVGIKPNGCKGPILCDARPIIDGCGWSLDVGVLIEAMRVGDTGYYYTHGGEGGSTWEEPGRLNKVKYLTFNLDPGLKVGLGYTSPHDDWKFQAGFEWLSSTGKSTIDEVGQAIRLSNTFQLHYDEDFVNIDFQEAAASLSIDYFLLDLAVSKGAYFSDRFSFEPLAGIKLNWINYNTTVRLSEAGNTLSELPQGTSWLKRSINDFWGVGPMLGFNANYHLFVGWSLFSKIDLAVLVGESYLKDGFGFVTNQKYPGQTVGLSNIPLLSGATRTMIGLQYERDLFEETQHLVFRVGFDGRYYYNQYPSVTYPAQDLVDEDETYFTPGYNISEGNYFGMVGLLIDLCWSY